MDPEMGRFPGTDPDTCAHIHGDIQRNPAYALGALQSLPDGGFQGYITGTQVPGNDSGILVTLIKGRNVSGADRYPFGEHINIDCVIVDADFLIGITSFDLVLCQRIQHIFARVRGRGADGESSQFDILHVVLGSLGVHDQEEDENSDADGENEGNENATEPGSAPKEVELLIEENSGLVRPGPMSGFPKGSPGKTSKQRRQDDFDLNRSLVEASNAEEVLSLVGSVLESRAGVQDNDLLSPTNVSTALHRIAKHMEREATHKSDRLSFARKRTMALLVSAATESLSQCSAQSISNIAWALSKVGGSSLYWAEMDLLAEAALSKISDLQSQHIANIAGAFASMQHSLPYLFDALDQRACLLYHTFQPQELAQFLWAFATLNEPAKRLLDLLDSECENSEQSNEERISRSTPGSGELSSNWTSAESHFAKFTLSELSSLSWSYTVLNELSRPSFALIWSLIVKMSQGNAKHFQVLSGQTMQLSQLHQVTLSLELEYPELDLLPGEPLRSMAESEWEKLKIGKKSTSTTQRDVEILLTSTGRQWVGEYSAASHSLDAALVEERIALEIDGPTHFARNTGRALGHTVLKRRQLSAAGWIVLSIPYQEWDELLGEAEQLEYLRDLLKQHL